jgi:hypothetical protein
LELETLISPGLAAQNYLLGKGWFHGRQVKGMTAQTGLFGMLHRHAGPAAPSVVMVLTAV